MCINDFIKCYTFFTFATMDLSSNLILVYSIFFLLTIGFAVIINALLLRVSKKMQLNNNANSEVRWQSGSKPVLGGIGLFILFLLSVSSYFMLPFHTASFFGRELFALLGASTLGFLIGLYDDALNMPAAFKFTGQTACGLFLIIMGIYIPLTPFAIINYAFTLLWVVAIMNSINMLDNMDGITASVSLSIVIASIMLLIMTGQIQSIYFIICIGVAGGLVGFLFFNWSPSKMYMGDNGSQFLGAFLSYLSIVLMWKFKDPSSGIFEIKQFLVPLVLFIIPIIDTSTVFIRRILRGQSPFVGGRDHTTHHLAYNGLKDGMVALVMFAISIISVGIAYLLVFNFNSWSFSKTLLVLAYVIVLFVVMQLLYERGKKLNKAKKSFNNG